MPDQIALYLFEYDRPPGPTGRARKPQVTRHRMTIAEAKERHGDAYRPILSSVEYRPVWDGKVKDFEAYPPGEGPVHWK